MFGEVMDEQVPTIPGDARTLDVRSDELLGEGTEEFERRGPVLEHLAVAVGVGTASSDDVPTVGPPLAGGSEERAPPGERSPERLAEVGRRRGVQPVADAVERDDDGIAVGDSVRVVGRVRAVGRLVRGAGSVSRAVEFLDQPRPRGFLYPPNRRGMNPSPWASRVAPAS